MDSFTQIAIGCATAELVAGKQLKNKTFLYGSIIGTIPDLDVIVGKFMSTVDGVAIHRGLSHSLLFFVFLAPILGFIVFKIEKGKIDYKTATSLAFWCLLTHVILDTFTSWGTQVLWPLDTKFAFKTIFVIDPLYTIPLAICLIYVFKSKNYFQRKKYLKIGLLLSSAYLLLTCVLKLAAVNQFEKALSQQNIAAQELIVKPTAFNTILWNANIATSDGYFLGDYSFFDSQSISFTFYERDSVLEKKLEQVTDFEKLKHISEGWYTISEDEGILYFNDLRFGLLNTNPQKPQFAFSYAFVMDKEQKLVAKEVPKAKRDGKVLLGYIISRIKGN